MPLQGRTVRCGVCKHSWHAMPVQVPVQPERADFADLVADASAAEASAAQFQLPVIVRKPIPAKPLMIAAPAIAVLWLITAFYANYASWYDTPFFSAIYRMAGVIKTDGLTFSKARLSRQNEGQRTTFVVSGEIANESGAPRTIPQVRLSLRDAEGEEIASRIYVVNKRIKPGGTYPFRITNLSTSFGSRVEEAVLDLGHDLQMQFR